MADKMAEATILVNLDRCVGCWSCAMACKIGNGLSDETWWAVVRTLGSGEGIDRPSGVWPNCTMGWIPIWSNKCVLCAGRTKTGEQPYCVYNCPTDALLYGVEEEGSAISTEIERLGAKGYRIFKLPVWEESKPNITYASKR
jgi:molybdopterin-containing oxidoreductase family iron-sulfur binding subunit